MDFDALLQLVVHKKASDLFITSGWAPTIKVNGALQQVSKTRLSASQSLDIVKSIMSEDQKKNLKKPKNVSLPFNAQILVAFVSAPSFKKMMPVWSYAGLKPAFQHPRNLTYPHLR